MSAAPVRVLVTGAAGQIGYSLVYSIAKGDVFGTSTPVALHLLDIPPMMGVLKGVQMELQDCAFPLLKDVLITDKEDEAFKDIDSAFLVGAMPRREGMERKDLLAANVRIFKSQGRALDKYAKKTVKVLVVGNPANTNALICSKYAPSIPKANFSAMTRLDHNRAIAQIAAKLALCPSQVHKMIIWGNHSSTQYPDVSQATVEMGGKEVSVGEALKDNAYLESEFVNTVQKRGAAVIAARKLSSAMSAAKAAGDHMRDWFHGTAKDDWVSMAVISDGSSYGAPADVMFSFPVRISPSGEWNIVKELELNKETKERIEVTAKELLEERDMALSVCED